MFGWRGRLAWVCLVSGRVAVHVAPKVAQSCHILSFVLQTAIHATETETCTSFSSDTFIHRGDTSDDTLT